MVDGVNGGIAVFDALDDLSIGDDSGVTLFVGSALLSSTVEPEY